MNCEDMVKIPELENVLLLKAGAGGMKILSGGFILQTAYSVCRVNIKWKIISTAGNLSF